MEVIDLSREKTIINRFVRELRDVDIHGDMMRFRRNLERVGEFMAFRVSERLNYHELDVVTPLGTAVSNEPSDEVVLGTILRASIPMHTGMLNVFDRADNAFATAYRKYTDDENFDIVVSYIATPKLEGKILMLADPMLATGESIVSVYRAVCEKGGKPACTHLLAAIATVEGVAHIEKELHGENITIWCAAIDSELNAHSYIVPGLGDAGDLAYGAKL